MSDKDTRVFSFGKHFRVDVTFRRIDGLWHAHTAMLPMPTGTLRRAKQVVANRLDGMSFVARGGRIVIDETEDKE